MPYLPVSLCHRMTLQSCPARCCILLSSDRAWPFLVHMGPPRSLHILPSWPGILPAHPPNGTSSGGGRAPKSPREVSASMWLQHLKSWWPGGRAIHSSLLPPTRLSTCTWTIPHAPVLAPLGISCALSGRHQRCCSAIRQCPAALATFSHSLRSSHALCPGIPVLELARSGCGLASDPPSLACCRLPLYSLTRFACHWPSSSAPL
mmetsp:Transcript_73152/g.161449  ORF Transcript_73152/g.161449 Transcript_73152/m.161449 type:complete len:205 (+) Transcript_73152:407-1021(+)